MSGGLPMRRGLSAWVIAVVAMTMPACKPVSDAASLALGKSNPGTTSVMIDSVNYMHERGVSYTVYDLSKTPPRAIGGAMVDSLATGGEKGCCMGLPNLWRPGLKLRLVWRESDRLRTYEETTRDLEVPRYEAPADLYVVFYPGHEVELVVSLAEPGHPEWRGKIKKTPWNQCVETYGRKPCFAELPKQFDTASSKGECTYMKEHDFPDADNLCAFAMSECVRDFEDEPFCKDLLWYAGKR